METFARTEREDEEKCGDLTFETVPVDPPAGFPMPRVDGHKFRRPRRSFQFLETCPEHVYE